MKIPCRRRRGSFLGFPILGFPVWVAFASLLFLGACSVTPTGQLVLGPSGPGRDYKPRSDYRYEQRSAAYPSTRYSRTGSSPYRSEYHHFFVDEEALPTLTPDNSRIEILLGAQRARVYRTGQGPDKLVIETQISTGKEGHSTPAGSFRILEKSVEKKSNLYGIWVNQDTGAIVEQDGDSRRHPGGRSQFQGTPMPYWMRVTPGGVGMHVGYVPNYPASHGCIRVPRSAQTLIFSKTKVGTPVLIRR